MLLDCHFQVKYVMTNGNIFILPFVITGGSMFEYCKEVGWFIFGIQLLGYVIKGLIGFGNPLFAAPILAMRLDNVIITPGTLLLDLPVNGYITWKNRHSFDCRRVILLSLAMLLGVIPGTVLLKFSMPWILKALLGCIVVGLGIEMLLPKTRTTHKESAMIAQMIVAFFSGMCAGLFGINLLIIAYLRRTAKDYNEFKGSMCFLFLGENVFRSCIYAISGLITQEVLLFGIISVPAAILGMFFSNRIGRKLEEEKLLKGASLLFVFGGISIIIKSILFHA